MGGGWRGTRLLGGRKSVLRRPTRGSGKGVVDRLSVVRGNALGVGLL